MSKKEGQLSRSLLGIEGEYSVAAELTRLGFIASLTLKNAKGIDILASNSNGSKTVSIQVKTHDSKKDYWILNDKADHLNSDNLFYVFVRIKPDKTWPDFYIVPSKVVAEYSKNRHENYMKTPSKKGENKKNSSMRKFAMTEDGKRMYLNNWEVMRLEEK